MTKDIISIKKITTESMSMKLRIRARGEYCMIYYIITIYIIIFQAVATTIIERHNDTLTFYNMF